MTRDLPGGNPPTLWPDEPLVTAGLNRMPCSRTRAVEHLLILLGLVALFVLLFGTTLRAYFSVLEEHRVVSDSRGSVAEWLDTVIEDTRTYGRFRPMFFVFHFAKILFFGPNPQVFHIVAVGLGILTLYLFYIAARRVGADVVGALTFVLLFSITARQSVIWYQVFAPQETLGLCLTAAAVWLLVKAAAQGGGSWDATALLAMGLAGLTKESFVLTIPALLLLRWTLQCWFARGSWLTALRTLHSTFAVGLAIFGTEIGIPVAIVLLRPMSYGATAVGLSLSSFDPRVWWQLLVSPELL